MRHQFTPAAQRAILAASRWSLRADDEPEVDAPQLLLGLLAESECRAATVLARLEIDQTAVRERWPALRPSCTAVQRNPPTIFSRAVDESLGVVLDKLEDYPRPLMLATEHLLLGLAAADHETSRWLAERGLDVMELEQEIHRRAGRQWIETPLDFPNEPRPATPLSERTDAAPGEVAVLRVLDAAANRAREGLRVVEDYVRFALDDAFLTGQWKQLRHDLTAALGSFLPADLLAARETIADIGTQVTTTAEQTRTDLASVLAASASRLQEALRSLEEYAKVLDPEAAMRLEQLRYRSYTLQRATDITRRRADDLAGARLYVLIDGRSSLAEFDRLVQSLVDAGVDLVQLRDKQLDDRTLIERARRLSALTRDTSTRFIMNDRADLAALADADGVHVGQEELSVKDARTIVGPRRLVGVSTHTLEQARQAVLDGADYIGVGPVFPSVTKQFERFAGLELLCEVAAETRLPAFAIGGITLENLGQVLATGITRVAIGNAIVGAADPAGAAKEFIARLK